jgi:hypothetical protein
MAKSQWWRSVSSGSHSSSANHGLWQFSQRRRLALFERFLLGAHRQLLELQLGGCDRRFDPPDLGLVVSTREEIATRERPGLEPSSEFVAFDPRLSRDQRPARIEALTAGGCGGDESADRVAFGVAQDAQRPLTFSSACSRVKRWPA